MFLGLAIHFAKPEEVKAMKNCIICGIKYSPQKGVFGDFCSNDCAGISRRGKNAYQWKGDEALYIAKHNWVVKIKGKPNKCEVCGCDKIPEGKKRFFQWSNVDHKYSRKLEDYVRMCQPCHEEYDTAHFYVPKVDPQKVKDLFGKGLSLRAIGRELGLVHSTVKRYLGK